jgi:hypothetical protein
MEKAALRGVMLLTVLFVLALGPLVGRSHSNSYPLVEFSHEQFHSMISSSQFSESGLILFKNEDEFQLTEYLRMHHPEVKSVSKKDVAKFHKERDKSNNDTHIPPFLGNSFWRWVTLQR